MKNGNNHVLRNLFFVIALVPFCTKAQQQGMHPKTYNYTTFSERGKELSKELYDLTPAKYYTHPEFGQLPYDAPCENCMELLQYRTDSARMFVEKGTNGTAFYSQKCFGIMNIPDGKGNLLAINPLLTQKQTGVYTAEHQYVLPTELNINLKQSSFNLPNGEKFAFNRNLELIHVSNTNITTSLGVANWSNYTIGDEGIHVIDAWPNIDIEIAYGKDRIESKYIIKAPLGFGDGSLIFRDKLGIPNGFLTSINSDGGFELVNESLGYEFEVEPAFGYDYTGEKTKARGFSYTFDTITNVLDTKVPVAWMNDLSMTYPLTVDPTVTSSATYSAGEMYFQYSGSGFCPGDGLAGCAYNLSVPKPPNCTITGATFGMQYITGYVSFLCGYCTLSDAGVYFTTACGRNPTSTNSFWYCNSTSSYGTCSGVNIDISSSVTCYTPACSGNIPFTMYTQRCQCSLINNNCVVGTKNCAYQPNNSWSVTVTGRTLEAIADQTYNVASCSGTFTSLNPAPGYGVPSYTYAWNTGATTSTINAPNAGGPYSVTVTDACGVTDVVNFTINCPLAIEFNAFSAEKIGRSVLLQWETASEKDNDYFTLERAGKDAAFVPIAQIPAVGNSTTIQNYSYTDLSPLAGTSYYRLKIVDKSGNAYYSETKSVGFDSGDNLLLIPNPNNGHFQLAYHFPAKGNYLVEVCSSNGKLIYSETLALEGGYQELSLTNPALAAGVYIVKLHTNNQVLVKKMVVE